MDASSPMIMTTIISSISVNWRECLPQHAAAPRWVQSRRQ
jgi:hypothetical protein